MRNKEEAFLNVPFQVDWFLFCFFSKGRCYVACNLLKILQQT